MKAIIRKSDRVALYLLPDDDIVNLNQFGLSTNRGLRAVDVLPETHEIVENVPSPEMFIGGAMAWDNDWTVANRELLDAAEAQATEKARTEAKIAMVAWINNFLNRFIAPYPQAEVLTWPLQSQAARAFKADEATTVQSAFLIGLAEKRGITPDEMADVIIAKADPYEVIVQETGALRSFLSKQIDEASYKEIPAILRAGQEGAIAKAQALGVL